MEGHQSRPRRRPSTARTAASLTVAFIASVSLGLQPAAAQQPEVTFDPTSGPSGTVVTAEGFGFEPGEAVRMIFGEVELASGAADEEGFARLAGEIPEGFETGSHEISIERADGSRVSSMFEVTPSPEPPPPSETQEPSPATTPTSTPTQVEPTITPSAVASPIEEGSDSSATLLLWILLACLVLLIVVLLIVRKKQPVVMASILPDWLRRLFGGGTRQRGPCRTEERRKIDQGSYVANTPPKRSGGPQENCTWTMHLERRRRYYYQVSSCTLQEGHRGDHVYPARHERNDPASGPPFEESIGDPWVETYEDPTCSAGAAMVTEILLAPHRPPAPPADPTPPPPKPCRVCGEPRGDAATCPHCGMQ